VSSAGWGTLVFLAPAVISCSTPNSSYRPPPDWLFEEPGASSSPRAELVAWRVTEAWQEAEELDRAADVDPADVTPADVTPAEGAGLTDAQRRSRVWWLNAGGAAGITVYGFVFWDWGSSSFGVENEGGLEDDSKHGGADKLGHAWAAYALTGASAALYRDWGYDRNQAALYGSGTSLLITTIIEVGDGFSGDHGFSTDDLLANIAGVGFEYCRQIYPPLAKRVMYRWEWTPSEVFWEGEADPSTDYSGSRYLLAFPLRGWGATGKPWRWLELQAGVYAQGYAEAAPFFDQERATFVGVGLNLTAILEDAFDSSALYVFDYFQLPGISVRTEWVEEID